MMLKSEWQIDERKDVAEVNTKTENKIKHVKHDCIMAQFCFRWRYACVCVFVFVI